MREGLLEGLLTSWSTSLIDMESDLGGVWDAAVEERLVSGTPSGLVRAFVREKSGLSRVAAKKIADLLPYLRQAHLEPLIKIQGAFDEQFLQQANKVTEIALRELWGKEKYVTAIEAIADLFGAKGFQSAYAATWYRTFVLSLGYNQSQLQILRDTPAGRLFPYLRYRTQRDAAVRPAHARLEGFTASSTWPLWPAFKPPLGWNCFLEGTIVSGRFVGGSKALYSGKAVDLQTSRGNRLRVTPNHPVLTTRGMLPASQIKKGDYLLCYLGDVEAALDLPARLVDEKDPPATVEEVFNALSSQAADVPASFYSPSNLDLHGDAMGVVGEVEVVGTYRKLSLQGKPGLLEVVGERGLAGGELQEVLVGGLRTLGALGDGSLPPPRSRPSGGALSLDELALLLDRLPLQELRLGSSSELDSSLLEDSGEGLATDGEFVRKCLERYPALVALDECVYVEWFDFHGHIYDFESPLGWIVAENIFTSNCRCWLQKLTWLEARARGLTGDIAAGVSAAEEWLALGGADF